MTNQHNFLSLRRAALTLLCALGGLFTLTLAKSWQEPPQEDVNPRGSLDRQFRDARPPARGAKPVRPKSTPAKLDHDAIGVTVWRLRTASAKDPESVPRELFQEGEYVLERAKADTAFREGDLIQISVEYPRPGRFYLYVIDREEYSDGTPGPPTLIYPSRSMPEGGNVLAPGRSLYIPAYDDKKPYFRLRRNSRRSDQVSERLTLIISQNKLSLGDDEMVGPLELDAKLVAKWEQDWGAGAVKGYEMSGGAGRFWTRVERDADVNRKDLDQVAPLPQTAYRIAAKVSGKVALVVPLNFAP